MAGDKNRNIIHIDEKKCNGCGQCVLACAEGAIAIIDGKARLISEHYCDGLGACLGECPQGAITIAQRPAEAYDVTATRAHLADIGRDPEDAYDPGHPEAHSPSRPAVQTGCPGAGARTFAPAAKSAGAVGQQSALGQWPVQLMLVPPEAPYFQGADLLITADCVPIAYADYHADLLAGKAVVVGCPKLDDAQFYIEKLAAIFAASDIRSVTVAIMEVPCCRGLSYIVEQALVKAGKPLPVATVVIALQGQKIIPVTG
jgi:Pyruvate/2-oxoacid:ferredoxin oxidoreductase delta subunit